MREGIKLHQFLVAPKLQQIFLKIMKSKQLIHIIKHNGYIKMHIQIKLDIFLNFFYYLLRWVQNSVV
jgi:ppGpp synthetase/RelA/SpoT-type nucleotidyltranferase